MTNARRVMNLHFTSYCTRTEAREQVNVKYEWIV
jgi:hypothetical protein